MKKKIISEIKDAIQYNKEMRKDFEPKEGKIDFHDLYQGQIQGLEFALSIIEGGIND